MTEIPYNFARPPSFVSDALAIWDKGAYFRYDTKFIETFESSAEDEEEKSWQWRIHVLCWAGKNALSVEGDFVELGTFRGFMSQCVMKYINWEVESERSFYLYDTFSGFDEAISDKSDFGGGFEWMQDAQQKYANPDNLKKVKERMSIYSNVNIVKGSVPDSLRISPSKIAYLHIDLNSPKAEGAALEILFNRMSPGGFILLDDYGWFNMQKQKDVHLQFFTARGIPILELPTGQGLVIIPAPSLTDLSGV